MLIERNQPPHKPQDFDARGRTLVGLFAFLFDGFPEGLQPVGFPVKRLCANLPSPSGAPQNVARQRSAAAPFKTLGKGRFRTAA